MKKLIALLLVLVLALSMAACGESESSFSRKDKSDRKPTKDKTNQATMADDTDNKETMATVGIDEDDDDSATKPNVPGNNNNGDKKPTDSTQTIPALPVEVKTLPAATIKTFSGNMTKTDQVDLYTYQPEQDGWYTFELSEVRAEIVLEMAIYDRLGNRLTYDTYAVNGDYINVELKKGETYTFKVFQDEGFGNYVLSIGEQTASTDISAFSAVNDSVKFNEQRNFYTFTPQLDGCYALTLSEVKASIVLEVVVFDRLGNRVVYDTYAVNDDALTMDLKGGDTYTIVVYQDESVGNYTLNIGKQKATVNMTVGKKLTDSVEFYGQINLYTFTATDTIHSLELTNLASGTVIEAYVLNYLEEKEAYDTYYINGDVLSMSSLTVGQTYTLQICQDTAYGNYTLTLK